MIFIAITLQFKLSRAFYIYSKSWQSDSIKGARLIKTNKYHTN